MDPLHPLLLLQLRKLAGGAPDDDPDLSAIADKLEALLQTVSRTYASRDSERELLVKNLDLTTNELIDRNRKLREDLAHRREVEEELLRVSRIDMLTGLANRRAFHQALDRAVARAHRNIDSRFSVLFIDLDRFKAVNDTVGHVAGDRFLRAVADRLREACREADLLARIGGDEFAVLLAGISVPEAARVAGERLAAALQDPFEIDGRSFQVTASIGAVGWDDRFETGEDMLRDADTALYQAKAAGRSRAVLFDEAAPTRPAAPTVPPSAEPDTPQRPPHDEGVFH